MFSRKPWKVFHSYEKPLRVFWKTLGEGFSQKTFLVFQEIFTSFSRSVKNLYGFSKNKTYGTVTPLKSDMVENMKKIKLLQPRFELGSLD
jgi:hypothetical protein